MKKTIITLLLIIPVIAGIACAKKVDGEDPKAAKARKLAVYSAQTVTAFDTLHNVTAVLQDNNAVTGGQAIAVYKFNDTALTSFDVLRSRLESGLPSDSLDRVDAILNDVEKLEGDLALISDPNARNKFAEAVFTVRFTLNSIRAVIAASKEPSFGEVQRVARQAAATRAGQPAWWTDVILTIQTGLIRAIDQSRMSAAEAWADATALSAQVHAKNKARIG